MTTNANEALILTVAMAAAIFFCRAFAFLFFREKNSDNNTATSRRKAAFLQFVEKTVPPAAMTVLAFNALAGPVRANPGEIIPVAVAAAFTAAVHIWKRNPLFSIFGGTALFIALQRLI